MQRKNLEGIAVLPGARIESATEPKPRADHLSDDDLDRLCLKMVGEFEAAQLMRHIRQCSDCAARLELTRDFIGALQSVAAGPPADAVDSIWIN